PARHQVDGALNGLAVQYHCHAAADVALDDQVVASEPRQRTDDVDNGGFDVLLIDQRAHVPRPDELGRPGKVFRRTPHNDSPLSTFASAETPSTQTQTRPSSRTR